MFYNLGPSSPDVTRVATYINHVSTVTSVLEYILSLKVGN